MEQEPGVDCPNWSNVCLVRDKAQTFRHSQGHAAGRVQLGQRVAIYCRVSTADQSCERQERKVLTLALRAGYEVVGIYKETGSGARLDRVERKKVMALDQARQMAPLLESGKGA